MTIAATPAERRAKKLTDKKLAQAVKAFRKDGYLALEDVVDHDCLDRLRERMDEDSQKLIAAGKWGGAGHVKGHLQQGPPPFSPYMFQDVAVNPFAVQVCEAVLGAGIFCSFYNGNSNTPGSGDQPLHSDNKHLWPDQETAHPTAQIVVNIAPLEVTEENGAIELWPGSHMDPRPITEETRTDRRKLAPPVRGCTKKGSLLMRDMRLWHRGVPNRSDVFRHMIAVVYNIRWLNRGKKLMFGKGCEAVFEGSGVDPNAVFIDYPFEYLFEIARWP